MQVILNNKNLLHKALTQNNFDLPTLDAAISTHGFLLDIYHSKVFVLKLADVRSCLMYQNKGISVLKAVLIHNLKRAAEDPGLAATLKATA